MRINIPITHRDNYYSRRLVGGYRALYDACLDNLSVGSLTVSASVAGASQDEVYRVMEAVLCGCPELFYVHQDAEITAAGDSVTINFRNKYEGENIGEMRNRLNAEIDRIAAKALALPTEYERIQRVNKYLCARVKPMCELTPHLGDAYGALILKQARCEGYAKAALLIFERIGMQSVILCGEAVENDQRVAHAWNMVYMGGVPYQFDFSWNAARTVHDIAGQQYSFLPDSDMYVRHFPKYDYPVCTDATRTFWARNKGIIKYHSDLCKARAVQFGKNYLVIVRLNRKLTQYELDNDVPEWIVSELSAYTYGQEFGYDYDESLDLVSCYFINP